jgi:hypothetical protein
MYIYIYIGYGSNIARDILNRAIYLQKYIIRTPSMDSVLKKKKILFSYFETLQSPFTNEKGIIYKNKDKKYNSKQMRSIISSFSSNSNGYKNTLNVRKIHSNNDKSSITNDNNNNNKRRLKSKNIIKITKKEKVTVISPIAQASNDSLYLYDYCLNDGIYI